MEERVTELSDKMRAAFGERIPFMQVGYPRDETGFAKLKKAVDDSLLAGRDLLGEDEYYGYIRLEKEGCIF